MKICTTKAQIATHSKTLKTQKKTIGFVPTMGALHQGHLSLISKAIQETDHVIVSVFVNPTQFNNTQDLDTYPRTLEADVALLKTLNSNNLSVYAPSAKEVYSSTIEPKGYDFGSLERVMEGAHRPGHFDGVGTVLNLLFRQVQPDAAFFGEKDFQQLQVVKKLVQKEKLSVQIIGCPIFRASSGLAMSSRNVRLSQEHYKVAPQIYRILSKVKEGFNAKSVRHLRAWVEAQFEQEPLLELEYFEMANIKHLKPLLRKRKNQKYRAFIAVWAGDVRLIDNIALN